MLISIFRKAVRAGLVAAVAAIGLAPALATAADNEVNIYSSRKEALIKPLLDRFTQETGIAVNLVTGEPDQLHARLVAEGMNSPADLLITADVANLYRAAKAGLFQPVHPPELEAVVPPAYRDPEGQWYGLSLRARVVVYAKDRVDPSQITDYLSLADPRWKGRLLTRSSSHPYNQSLIAAMIATHGEKKAEAWAKGLVANFARRPQGGDTDQIRAVAAGEGDLAIVNTYYYGRILASDDDDEEDKEIAAKTGVVFPVMGGRGTHVNISGGGVLAHAPNRDNAIKLLDFMASPEAQHMFASLNQEYPIDPNIPPSDVIAAWGKLTPDDLPLLQIGALNGAALRLADRVGWR